MARPVLASKVARPPAAVEGSTRGVSWSAIVVSATTVLVVAFISGIPNSPYRPSLPQGADPLAPFAWVSGALGLDTVSRVVLQGLAIGALVLASGAFVFAVWEAWRGRLPLRWVVGMAIVFHVVAFAMPLFVSNDVYHYAAYGRLASVHGVNPYVAAPSDFPSDPYYEFLSSDWRGTPALYGPVFVQTATLVTSFVESPEAMIWAFKGLAAMASLATVFLVAWVVRRAWPERAAFAAGMLALNPVVLFSAVAGGHMDPLIGLGIVAALGFVVESGRSTGRRALAFELAATAALAAIALMKSPLAVLLALHVVVGVLRRPRGERARPLLLHGAVTAALVLPLVLPYLQGENPLLGTESLSRVVTYLSSNAFWVMGGNLVAPVLGVWIGRAMVLGARVGFPLAFLVGASLVVLTALRQRRPDWRQHVAAWGWTMVLFLLTAPILWPWYLLWVLPVAWLLPWKPRATLIGLAAALPLFQVVGVPDRYRQLFEANVLLGVFLLGPALLVALFWVLRDLARARADGSLVDGVPS